MYLLNMTASPRFRGRKPNGYVPIESLEQAWMCVIGNLFHRI